MRVTPLNQRSIPLALLAAAALAILIRIIVPEPVIQTRVNWVEGARAAALAKQKQKPILYDFTADWCPPCRTLDRELWANEDIARIVNRDFVAVRVDASNKEPDLDPAVAALKKRYGVDVFPTLVITHADGRELRRQEGFGGRRRLERFLTQK